MKFGHYYVVEVSYRPGNPIHRAIAHSARADGVTLVASGYERPIVEKPGDLAYFRVVEEIKSMRENPEFLMPVDAKV